VRAGVVLIGLRRAGKTSVGRALARRSGRVLLDLDDEVARLSGHTPGVILRDEGELCFRAWERAAVQGVLGQPGAVVACGGGTPVNEDCGDLLVAYGQVLYLEVSASELMARARAGENPKNRPLLAGSSMEEEVRLLLAARDPVFRELADHVVPAGAAPQVVLELCLAALGWAC